MMVELMQTSGEVEMNKMVDVPPQQIYCKNIAVLAGPVRPRNSFIYKSLLWPGQAGPGLRR